MTEMGLTFLVIKKRVILVWCSLSNLTICDLVLVARQLYYCGLSTLSDVSIDSSWLRDTPMESTNHTDFVST